MLPWAIDVGNIQNLEQEIFHSLDPLLKISNIGCNELECLAAVRCIGQLFVQESLQLTTRTR